MHSATGVPVVVTLLLCALCLVGGCTAGVVAATPPRTAPVVTVTPPDGTARTAAP